MRARVFVVCAVVACAVGVIGATGIMQETKKAPPAAKAKSSTAAKSVSPEDAATIKKAESRRSGCDQQARDDCRHER